MKLFYIKSQSIPGKEYIVRDLGAEGWRCSCPAFVFEERTKGECKHIKYQKAKQNEAKNDTLKKC